MADKSGLLPLDISGPAHVVAERWRNGSARLSYAQGKNLWDKKAQLTSLLLHLAGEAVQDVMASLELTIDEDGEEDIFSQTIDALD